MLDCLLDVMGLFVRVMCPFIFNLQLELYGFQKWKGCI